MNENEFLARITAPTLGSSSFAQDLSEAFKNIDDNFKKIVSAPYLEGQEGRSIEPIDMPLLEEDGVTLTQFGTSVVECIFGDSDVHTLTELDELHPTYGVGTNPVSKYIREHSTIKVLSKYNPDSGQIEDYICSAEYYCYLDMRIADLDRMQYPSQVVDFYDYTCQIFGSYDTEAEEWSFTKGVMLPTLYFNPDQGFFCWKINNVETGIRAQGIKGDDGRPPVAAVVKGVGRVTTVGNSSVIVVNVDSFSSITTRQEEGETIIETSWEPIRNSGLQNGDMVCCILSMVDQEYGTVYPDMLIGNITKTGEDESTVYTIMLPDSNRFSNLWRSYLLFYAFRDIDYKGVDGNKTKAVFVPGAHQGVTHAMFQNDSNVQYYSQAGVWSSTDTNPKDDLVFKKVSENRLIGRNSYSTSTRMTSPDSSSYISTTTKARFEGYNLEVSGTSKAKVSGCSDVLLGVPVGSVVSWINTTSIPEGWYITGEVTTYVDPVFAFAEISVDSANSETDVIIRNGNTVIARLQIRSIVDGNMSATRDSKFKNIFCALTGYTLDSNGIVSITTDQMTLEGYISDTKFMWPELDIDISLEDYREDGIKFYLTRRL